MCGNMCAIEKTGTNLESASVDLLHADHVEWEQVVEHHHGVHHHVGEEVLLVSDEL